MCELDKIIDKANEVLALIEPLGELERHAVLEMADVLRAYRRASLALEGHHPFQASTSEPPLEASTVPIATG